ncbi:MAG: cation:proton antiporter [Patescibacteria group bacterium]
MKVGMRAGLGATVCVVLPFILGTYIVGPWLMPGLSMNTYLFIGATLTATSVGLTARVFKDLGRIQTPEAQIVLGAAVIDDVMGLVILAVVSAIVTVGSVSIASVSIIILKALAFLVGSIVIGRVLAPRVGRLFSTIHTGVGMKLTLALCFGLVFAYLADFIGLAPIVGAFAAGLVLDPVHFKYFRDPKIVEDVLAASASLDATDRERISKACEEHSHRHVEDLVEPIGHFVVPVFFVLTGMAVRLETLFNPAILLVALGLTIAAFIGKIAAGSVAGNVNKWLVGWGMVPRGEVGLIFAITGRALGVVNDEVYSVVVVMVILSTLLTPPVLTFLLKRASSKGEIIAAPKEEPA